MQTLYAKLKLAEFVAPSEQIPLSFCVFIPNYTELRYSLMN